MGRNAGRSGEGVSLHHWLLLLPFHPELQVLLAPRRGTRTIASSSTGRSLERCSAPSKSKALQAWVMQTTPCVPRF